jgi:formate hydrogenlyase subunit 4
MGARAINAILGFWLFLSAFLWPHALQQRYNAWIVGALVVTLALAGLSGHRWARALNALLGGWLIVTTLLWPRTTMLTYWNQMLVGLAVAMFAFAPSLSALRRRTEGPV